MSASGLTVFIIAKNASKDLSECLNAVQSVADDRVVVVDDSSADGTADAARALTPNVWVRPFEGFSAMKQFALSRCKTEWALNLDTDERPSPALLEELARAKRSPEGVSGYFVNRLPYFLGTPIRHGGWYPDWVLRLVRTSQAQYPPRPVHERLTVQGPTARLSGNLLHFTVSDWSLFLGKQRRFAELSQALPSWWARWTHPPAAFFKSAVLQAGFLDGWRGMAVAFAQGYYSYYKYCKKTDEKFL